MSVSADPTEPAPWDFIRIAMVIGPVSGYFHQYYTMYNMKTSIGFSSVTCGVLIISSIIRIFFWIGDPFDIALLYQSILMTVVQLFLLELCVRYYPWTVQLPTPITHSRPPSRPSSRNSHNNSNNSYTIPTTMSRQGSDHITTRASRYHSQGWYKKHAIYWGTHFWNWPTIWPYYIFLAFFTLFVGLSLLIIGKTEFYVGLLGLAALGIESTVPMPQAIQNYQSKSTAGFSPAILLMWVVGDSFKTYYYITTGAKYQFIGCGIIQLCVDCVIIIQTIIYSKYWKGAARRRYHASAVEEGRGGGKGRGRGLGQLGDYFLTGWPWSQDRTGSTQVNDRSSSEALLAGNGEDDDDNDDEILPYRHQPSHHH